MSIAKRAFMAWGSDFDSCSTGTGVLQPTPFRLTFMFAVHARAAGEKGAILGTALAWMPETGRTIFCFYTLRAAETGGPLGGGADCRLPEGKSKRARLGGLSAFWGWL